MTNITPTPRGEAIKMPEALKGKFRFKEPIYGGPVFDFPHLGLMAVDLSNLTEQMALRLIAKGYTGIEPVKEIPAKMSPLEAVTTAK